MSDEHAPMDARAMKSEEVIKAAIAWRWAQDDQPRLSLAEWKLYQATTDYGSDYAGLVAK